MTGALALVLLGAVFAITDLGPGAWSLDEALGTRRSGPGWAVAQLLAGALGSACAVALGERLGSQEATSEATGAAQAEAAEAAAEVNGHATVSAET